MLEGWKCEGCRNYGTCCRLFYKSYRPRLSDKEIERIKLYTGLKREDVAEKNNKGEWIIKFGDDYWCPFISEKSKKGICKIWEVLPMECRLYPLFCWEENGDKYVCIDMNHCPKSKDGLTFDLKKLLESEEYVFKKRYCKTYAKSIVLKVKNGNN